MSNESVSNLLVGRAVEISVGEPWDFESADGENALKGRITAIGQEDPTDAATQWVKIDVTPFVGKAGATVDHLEAWRRYALPHGIIDQIASGKEATVHLHYDDQVDAEALPEGSSPYLIGGLRLADL